jgi:hypothetical protein
VDESLIGRSAADQPDLPDGHGVPVPRRHAVLRVRRMITPFNFLTTLQMGSRDQAAHVHNHLHADFGGCVYVRCSVLALRLPDVLQAVSGALVLCVNEYLAGIRQRVRPRVH